MQSFAPPILTIRTQIACSIGHVTLSCVELLFEIVLIHCSRAQIVDGWIEAVKECRMEGERKGWMDRWRGGMGGRMGKVEGLKEGMYAEAKKMKSLPVCALGLTSRPSRLLSSS